MRVLVTRSDGVDVVLDRPAEALPPDGGVVMADGCVLTRVPFGFLEVVVPRGRSAGLVRRVDVGTYRLGAGPEADLPLPSGDALLDVGLGGRVLLDGRPWPVGTHRRVGGLDLLLRWVGAAGERAEAAASPDLPDVLLDALAGVVPPPAPPVWDLGRDEAGRPAQVPVTEQPVLVLTGPDRHALARAVLGRLLHAQGERVRLALLLADSPEPEAWAWTRWPHQARTGDERFVRAGFDDAACAAILRDLAPTPERWEVVVIDGADGTPPGAPRPGVAVLVLQETAPADPRRLVVVTDGSTSARLGGGLTRTVEVDLPEPAWIDHLARAMSRPGHAPTPLRLATLLGHEPDDPAALAAAWDRPPTTRIPLGVHGGEVVSIDLRTDGPHVLIGGTTGSGKSELLVGLVAGLASLNPPEAMSFLLIDYKGGAAFAECVELPHTLGLVTDLDVGATERALAALTAEVRRREELLASVGAGDLDAYLRHPRRPVPLARLVVVVDEFATLVGELPSFVDGLVDIARRGRSLGLHLVLATQRPAGAVNADIRANVGLRISLRAAEVEDSLDILGLPDAAALTAPGQALIRVGQEPLVPMQVARVTLPAPLAATRHGEPYVFGRPVGAVGEDSDLAVLARTAQHVTAGRGRLLPPRPWLPPLPDVVDIRDVDPVTTLGGAPLPPVAGRGVAFGVEDRPGEQRRERAVFDLDGGAPLAVVGGARSGRTTALRAVSCASVMRLSPSELHLHVIDAGAHGLGDLAVLPHTGAVVTREEPERLERLVLRLCAELDHRAQTLAWNRWHDVVEQRRTVPHMAWPTILLLVDRWDLLMDAVEEVDDRSLVTALERLAAEGGRVGIVVVATGERAMLTTRTAALFPDRLHLRSPDVTGVLAGEIQVGVPGRGWRGDDAVETQVAWVEPVPEDAFPGPRPETPRGPFRIDALPSLVTRDDALALAAGEGSGLRSGHEVVGPSTSTAPVADDAPWHTTPAADLVTDGAAEERGDGAVETDVESEPAVRDSVQTVGSADLEVSDVDGAAPVSPGGGDDPLRSAFEAVGGGAADAQRVSTEDAHRVATEDADRVGTEGHGPVPQTAPLDDPRSVSDERLVGSSAVADDPASMSPATQMTARSDGELLVAVGGDDLGPRWFDADEYGPCALVTGRRRTGRSGTLATFAESALAAGWEVAVVVARRSPLADLPVSDAQRARLHGPFRRDEDAEALTAAVSAALEAGRRILVVVDDVDLLLDGPLVDAVTDLPGQLRDTGSLLVASAEAEEIVAAYRGPGMALRRARCGVMLAPQGPADGEAFGVRLRRAQYERPMGVGSGFFVLDGLAERVQVIRSGYLPPPGMERPRR